MLEGLKQVCSEEEPLPDKWGLTLSGYAPILDSRGVSVGVVGVDVAGERIQMLRREFFWNAAGITGLSLLASLLGTLLVTRWFNRPVRKLLKGIRDLEAGNLEARVRLRTKDEFEILAEAFNGLAAGLREREAIRLAFERYVSREMSEHLLRRRQTSLAMTAEKVTFLYCDMAGCTHLAAPGERAKGAAFLNALMPRLLDAIFRYGGTAERVVDDGLLAVFGVGHQSPQQQEELAIRAALEAQFALHDVSEGLGLTKLRMGAGLHTMTLDPGASGTGATQQAALAQGAEWVMRLGRANRRLGTYILAEENVLRSVRHLFHVVPYPEVRMRMGRPPVTLFSIVGAISPGLPAEDKLLAAAKASGKSGPRPAV
jgi:adenylate cyclase